MGHPPPSAAVWRRHLGRAELSRPAHQLGVWIAGRPLADRPGLYRYGERPACSALLYGTRTVRGAYAELRRRGLLTVVEPGGPTRRCSVVELLLPGAEHHRQYLPVMTGNPPPVMTGNPGRSGSADIKEVSD